MKDKITWTFVIGGMALYEFFIRQALFGDVGGGFSVLRLLGAGVVGVLCASRRRRSRTY